MTENKHPQTHQVDLIRQKLAQYDAAMQAERVTVGDKPDHEPTTDQGLLQFVKYTRDLLEIMDHSRAHRKYVIYQRVRDWLRILHPDIFNAREPIPLKKGIHVELFSLAHGFFSHTGIRIFLDFWTKRPEYRQALKNSEYRTDLNGDRYPIQAEQRPSQGETEPQTETSQ